MALWSILVLSGYLKAARSGPIIAGESRPPFLLSIPNREVDGLYRTTFQSWMDKGLHASGGNIKALTTALLEGNAKKLQRQLEPHARDCIRWQASDRGIGGQEAHEKGGGFAKRGRVGEESREEVGKGKEALALMPKRSIRFVQCPKFTAISEPRFAVEFELHAVLHMVRSIRHVSFFFNNERLEKPHPLRFIRTRSAFDGLK